MTVSPLWVDNYTYTILSLLSWYGNLSTYKRLLTYIFCVYSVQIKKTDIRKIGFSLISCLNLLLKQNKLNYTYRYCFLASYIPKLKLMVLMY